MRLFLFTENFPFGKSETFLENEIPFLSEKSTEVVIIPQYKQDGLRQMPDNVTIWQSLLNFNPKDKKRLLSAGMFNLSPFGFAVKEFFRKKIYRKKSHLWNFFTSLFLFRSIYANKKLKQKLYSEIEKDDKLYFYWGDKSALLIPYLKKKIDNTVFVRFHRTDIYEEMRNGYIPFRKYLFPAIDWFVPIAEDGRKYLINHYPDIQSDKIHLSRLGVFDKGLNPERKDDDIFHLLSCSYLVPVKRVNLIVEALKHLDFEIQWTHIGAGRLFDNIKSEAENMPSNVRTNFLGMLSNREVMDFYRQNHVDLFINVSASEGVPVSIMEALAFGIPVMATDVGGTAEIVDNQVGKLLEANVSAQEIAEAIKSFAFSQTSSFRNNARNRWNERSNAEKNYKEFMAFLQN
jgi:glycosyltransferase involved in cell wall biosynthesis